MWTNLISESSVVIRSQPMLVLEAQWQSGPKRQKPLGHKRGIPKSQLDKISDADLLEFAQRNGQKLTGKPTL